MPVSKQRPKGMSEATRERLQLHLRGLLGCRNLWLDMPAARGATVQVRVGTNVVGTVDEVVEEGERSWTLSLVVLEEDLG